MERIYFLDEEKHARYCLEFEKIKHLTANDSNLPYRPLFGQNPFPSIFDLEVIF